MLAKKAQKLARKPGSFSYLCRAEPTPEPISKPRQSENGPARSGSLVEKTGFSYSLVGCHCGVKELYDLKPAYEGDLGDKQHRLEVYNLGDVRPVGPL